MAVSRDLIDIAVDVSSTAEGDQGDPRGHRIHRKVRQELRHEVQLVAEVLRADRAGCVHQKHHFHLIELSVYLIGFISQSVYVHFEEAGQDVRLVLQHPIGVIQMLVPVTLILVQESRRDIVIVHTDLQTAIQSSVDTLGGNRQ